MDLGYLQSISYSETLTDIQRLGVINCISKAPGLPDAPITNLGSPTQPAGAYYLDRYVFTISGT
jgi:hypothetical protein